MKKYELTDEHRRQLEPWADIWIKNALSTKEMDDEERETCIQAVKGLYEAADLEPPPPERIVVVPSPFVLRFAAGFAAAIWHLRKGGDRDVEAARAAARTATGVATDDATEAATRAATHGAARAATGVAIYAATDAETGVATRGATYVATAAATTAATRVATHAATDEATRAAARDATDAAAGDATTAATRVATRAAARDATNVAAGDATHAATYVATYGATEAATYVATYDATDAAAGDATTAATTAATYGATRAATGNATYDATHATTAAATRVATRGATYVATAAATYAATAVAARAATDEATRAATAATTAATTADAARATTDVATYDATDAAARATTDVATRVATHAATEAATYAATHTAAGVTTYEATDDATAEATDIATTAATRVATHAATGVATYAATAEATRGDDYNDFFLCQKERLVKLAHDFGLGDFGLMCAQKANRMWQGGNQWSGYAAFLSFFRHIAKLDIDYSKWDHWEKLALHSGPRVVHEKFCMISDRPLFIHQDAQNRPHCETGPFTKWRDGSCIYALHGTYVPAWLIETPKDKIDPKRVLQLENTEQRYVAMQFLGMHLFLDALEAELIDSDGDYKLYYLNIEGEKLGPYLLMACPSTGREFLEGVGDADKYENIDPTIKTCKEANEWRSRRASQGFLKTFGKEIHKA